MEELSEKTNQYIIEAGDNGTRLDIFISGQDQELTRTRVQKLIADECITVNEKPIKSNYKLKTNDVVNVEITEPEELKIDPEKIPLDVLYEDSDVIVINKPQGMVVHPANGNYTGTMVNALLEHCDDLSGINGVMRPGIVHRLDKDTSGVIMAAKNDMAHLSLAQQIKDHTVTRKYIALVHGNIAEPAGVIDAPIGRDPKDRKKMTVITQNSKNAVTRYRVLERFGEYTLIEVKLETGRTHQIRVHMAYLGHPVVGDPVYGPKKLHFGLNGQALHAYILGFEHPRSKQYMEFTTDIPDNMEKVLKKLKNHKV